MSLSKRLKEQYEVLAEKIHHLRMALVIETDAAVKFKLEKQIEEAETERNRIEEQLEGSEKLSVTCPYRGLFAFREQDAETQKITQYFIEFFEGKIDLPTLKARLAEYAPTPSTSDTDD